MGNSLPRPCCTITDLETLKAIANPLRLQIFEALRLESLTVKEVAERLGLAPTKLYYHVKQLESHGLIQVVETRTVANMIEYVYRATATSLEVDPALLPCAPDRDMPDVDAINMAVIDTTRADLQLSLEARAYQLAHGAERLPRSLMMTRSLSRIDEARADEFHARLAALVEEFEAADSETVPEGGDLQTYALSIVFYPRFCYPDADEEPAVSNSPSAPAP